MERQILAICQRRLAWIGGAEMSTSKLAPIAPSGNDINWEIEATKTIAQVRQLSSHIKELAQRLGHEHGQELLPKLCDCVLCNGTGSARGGLDIPIDDNGGCQPL